MNQPLTTFLGEEIDIEISPPPRTCRLTPEQWAARRVIRRTQALAEAISAAGPAEALALLRCWKAEAADILTMIRVAPALD